MKPNRRVRDDGCIEDDKGRFERALPYEGAQVGACCHAHLTTCCCSSFDTSTEGGHRGWQRRQTRAASRRLARWHILVAVARTCRPRSREGRKEGKNEA